MLRKDRYLTVSVGLNGRKVVEVGSKVIFHIGLILGLVLVCLLASAAYSTRYGERYLLDILSVMGICAIYIGYLLSELLEHVELKSNRQDILNTISTLVFQLGLATSLVVVSGIGYFLGEDILTVPPLYALPLWITYIGYVLGKAGEYLYE
jgi:hypothetical protein